MTRARAELGFLSLCVCRWCRVMCGMLELELASLRRVLRNCELAVALERAVAACALTVQSMD